AAVRVRMALHTGEPSVGEEGYLGLDVVRASRLCAAGHGGQILTSAATRLLLGDRLPDGVQVRDLGEVTLKDLDREHVQELAVGGAGPFPPLAVPRPGTAEEQLADRIERHVQRQLDRALRFDDEDDDDAALAQAPVAVTRVAATGLGVLALTVLVLVGL